MSPAGEVGHLSPGYKSVDAAAEVVYGPFFRGPGKNMLVVFW